MEKYKKLSDKHVMMETNKITMDVTVCAIYKTDGAAK